MIRVPGALLHEQIVAVLTAWGMPPEPAATTADVMVGTDLRGVDSHGVSMLMRYEKLLGENRLALAVEPEIVLDLPAFAVIDAHHGLGHPVGVEGMRVAVEKAETAGVGAVAVRNSHHFGALGHYALLAAERGSIGFVTTSTRTPVVTPIGGTTPVLGTNPLAFAAPRSGGAPVVLDMSTSVVAVNKVKARWLNGMDLPDGWVSDHSGASITSAAEAYARLTDGGATLAPLGGYKGYGLSLMVQILSTALVVQDDPGDIGHFFLAIAPELVNPGGRAADTVDALCRTVEATGPAVDVPGGPEERARADRELHGVPISAELRRQLNAVCVRAGAHWLLD